MLLSIIVPCFNEEEALPIFYQTMREYENQIFADIEYCFVDDGSKDSTLHIMRELCNADSRVHYPELFMKHGFLHSHERFL